MCVQKIIKNLLTISLIITLQTMYINDKRNTYFNILLNMLLKQF